MQAMIRYVGLDVHKRVVEACILDAAGKAVLRQRFELEGTSLRRFAREHLEPGDRVALEATTNCWAVAAVLRGRVAEVVVSNPLATQAIAQAKVKTDKVDAFVLAQLLRCDYLPRVWQPDEATRQLRELTGRRSALVGQRTAVRNRIHSVLAMRLLSPPMEKLFSPAGVEWLKTLELDPQGRLLVDTDLRLAAAIEAEIAALDQELVVRGYQSPQVKLLMTLPGVDVTVAEALVAALGDVSRFADGAHAASYLGLVPSTHQSARHCYHGPITKRGRSHARWMLIEAAQHLDKHPGPLGCFFRRLAKKKNRNVAVVATARKLAAIAWQMLTAGEPYRYSVPRSTETKLARLRVKATGQRRKSGPPKAIKCMAKLPGGSRTIRSLSGVCQSEGLPAPKPPSDGERRIVAQCGCQTFVEQLAQAHVVPRRSRKTPDAAHAEVTTSPVVCPASMRGFRRLRAGDQGDEAPPPGPPTLSSVPERKAAGKETLPAS